MILKRQGTEPDGRETKCNKPLSRKIKYFLYALCRMDEVTCKFNLSAPELFILILAHSVYKMWIIQEPNKLELWNKLNFKERKKNGEYTPCLKYSVPIFVE